MSFNLQQEDMFAFQPIIERLRISIEGASNDRHDRMCMTLQKHDLFVNRLHTKAVFFEATDFLNEDMQVKLGDLLVSMPDYDGAPRRCQRALANHFSTSSCAPATTFKPLLAPHRDDVGDADISVVLGITPRSDFRGAMLFVSTLANGGMWMNDEETPSRKCVVGLEVSAGNCILLKNKVSHYVSVLQRGSRGSIVFHMKKVE